MKTIPKNLPAQVVDVRTRDEWLHKKWKPKNKSVTPSGNSHYVFSNRQEEEDFYSYQFDTDEKKRQYKEYREAWWQRASEYEHGNAPLALIVETVSTCNLACSMCFTITDKFQNAITGATRMMPWSQFTKIIDDAKDCGVYSICLSWRGEATLYRVKDDNGNIKTFGDAIKYACSKNFLEVTSLTHGQNLTDELIEDILDAQPNWISFSVDGLEEEYNKIRTPRNKRNDKTYNPHQVVTENIQKLARKRDEKNLKLPRLRSNSIFPSISKYPDKYKSYMKSIGIDLVTTSEVYDVREHRKKNENINFDWSCSYPFQRMTVSANSIILPCPAADQEEEALVFGRYKGSPPKKTRGYDGKINLADIPENTINSAWHSKKWNNLRKMHQNKTRHLIDPGCRNCVHGDKKKGVSNIPTDWDLENMEWSNHPTKV
jgi:hypothetical protein